MENQFDSSNYPSSVPVDLVAGDFWAWNCPDITAAYGTDDYTLAYAFSLQEAPFGDYSFPATVIDGAFVVEVSATATKGQPAGSYRWQAMVTRSSDGETVTVDSNMVAVSPNLSGSPGDTRTWVARTLDAIRATLEGTASKEQASYEIGGRSISLRSIEDLLALEKEFAARYDQEQKAADLKAGRSVNNRVLVGMSA